MPLAARRSSRRQRTELFVGRKSIRGRKAPYFCIFEADFDSEAALMNGLGIEEGQAVAGDVPNYASGGVPCCFRREVSGAVPTQVRSARQPSLALSLSRFEMREA